MKKIVLFILLISFINVGCIFEEDQLLKDPERVEENTGSDQSEEELLVESRSIYLKMNQLEIKNNEISNQLETVFNTGKFNFDQGEYYEVVVYAKDINEKITGLSVALNYNKDKIKKIGYELNSPWGKGLTIEWSSEDIYQFNSALQSEGEILDGRNIIGRFIFQNIIDSNEGIKNIHINEKMTKMTTVLGKDENGNNEYETILGINFEGVINIKEY